jgi:hypothetical protein
MDSLKISDDDLLYWLKDEMAFLNGLKNDPPEITLQCRYVEALAKKDET